MVLDESGPNAFDLVGTNGRSDAAAAHGNAAIHFAGGYSFSQRDDEIWIVVVGNQLVGAKIDDFMTGLGQLSRQLLFQLKPAMIGRNSYMHRFPFPASTNLNL